MTAAVERPTGQRIVRVPAPRPPVDEAPARPRWQASLARTALISDLVVILVAATTGFLLGVGDPGFEQAERVSLVLAVISVVGVIFGLAAFRCWDQRILGQGSEEFNRLIRAYITCVVVLGLVGLAFMVDTVRGWALVILPLAGLASMAGRYVLRWRLKRQRRDGKSMLRVLAVGTDQSVADLIVRTQRVAWFGWSVTGACTSTGTGPEGALSVSDVKVVGDLSGVAQEVRRGRYDVVAVSPAPGWTPQRLQELSWDLEGTGVELVVDPGLTEVAGPRLHVAPVDGLPLLRLSAPRFTGLPRVAKDILDRLVAAVLIVILMPVLLAIAVAVRTDGGPAFFRQQRVGQGGRLFTMIKFRSMVVKAEEQRAQLTEDNDAAGPLFKIRNDPRVTRVGAFIRRHSLDELPQLFNVLTGRMSLVGPRPPLPLEADQFQTDAKRRLLVRPGMTGLWQVSGRSELSWEETVRLDLRYVENWTPGMDLMIIWKTLGAVFRGGGAY
jgi:exopolysaccharide biosynthesis polyprenyl glycosylphosphotransferase